MSTDACLPPPRPDERSPIAVAWSPFEQIRQARRIIQAEADSVKSKRSAMYDARIAILQGNPPTSERDAAITELQAECPFSSPGLRWPRVQDQ